MTAITPEQIFSVQSEAEFEDLALQIFRFQATENKVYSDFLAALQTDVDSIEHITDIPFLPIELFKSHTIQCGRAAPEIVFTSSGTTGSIQSKHPVKLLKVYEESFRKGFEYFYGDVKNYAVLALLPSYLEREGSSLIYMVDDLISQSTCPESGYFLYNHDELRSALLNLKAQGKKTLLIGVTYALLDFIETTALEFPELIVMETGGMKGKRREMIREELHKLLRAGFGVSQIHSEYGMTELLSQAYSRGGGKFSCPGWMKILIRDTNDPFALLEDEKTGGINIIDLANVYSCSFLATQDLGKRFGDGSFEVLGRFDNSDVRGCNLLIQ